MISGWTTNQNARSAENGGTQAKVRRWRPQHTRLQPPERQRNLVPIYAPGVALGILRKMKEEPGRLVDSRLNRPLKQAWSRTIGNYGHLPGFGCQLSRAAYGGLTLWALGGGT